MFASWGWFYDRFKYELPRGLFGGDTFLRTFATLDPTIPISQYTAADVLNAPDALTLNFRVPSNDPSDNRIDPDLQAQRQSEFTVGFERELFTDFILRSRYTRKQLDRTIEDVGFFDDQGNENFFIANPGTLELSDSRSRRVFRQHRKRSGSTTDSSSRSTSVLTTTISSTRPIHTAVCSVTIPDSRALMKEVVHRQT